MGPAVALVGWGAFAAYLIVQARAGPVIIWNDSTAYATVAKGSLGSLALWDGQRPPLTPLLIKLVGSEASLPTFQAVVAALAWGVLAWTVGRLVAPGWRRVVAVFVILAFASTLPIVQWNRSALSESVSMSLLALVFAASIGCARRLTWPRLAALVAVCAAFAIARDAQVWTVAFIAVAVGIEALWLGLRHRNPGRHGPARDAEAARETRILARRAGVLAGCLLAVVALAEWGTLSSHRTAEDVADVLFVRVFPFPDRVAWFAAHGMPEQAQIEGLARATAAPAHQAKVVGFSPTDPHFAALQHWITTAGPGTYVLWLATHPWYVISEPLQRPERSFNFAQGDLAFYAPLNKPLRSPLTPLLWPPVLELVVMGAFSLFLGVASGTWRQRPWRVVAVLGGIGVVAMLVAWHGDGQEVTRHAIEGFAQVRLSVWILAIVGLLGLPLGRRAGPGDDEQPQTTSRAAPCASEPSAPPASTGPAGMLQH